MPMLTMTPPAGGNERKAIFRDDTDQSLFLDKLVGRRTGWRDERTIAMELMHRSRGVSQPEIGKVMGDLDYTAVSRERKRLREKIKTERGLKAALDAIGVSLVTKVKI